MRIELKNFRDCSNPIGDLTKSIFLDNVNLPLREDFRYMRAHNIAPGTILIEEVSEMKFDFIEPTVS